MRNRVETMKNRVENRVETMRNMENLENLEQQYLGPPGC